MVETLWTGWHHPVSKPFLDRSNVLSDIQFIRSKDIQSAVRALISKLKVGIQEDFSHDELALCKEYKHVK